MSLQFTNTLTGRKEEFKPLKQGKVSLYVCGVTVYDDCHIGHARGAVVFDVLRRYLEQRYGYRVAYVRNITDLDDKIIDRARKETEAEGDLGAGVRAVAERYTQSFQNDFARLGLLPPTHEPRATEYIPQMVAFIQRLIERDMAYAASDGVYFSVRKFPEYGALSHQRPDQMFEGARVEPGEGKRDPLDFALWKKAKPDEPRWESPWGPGRPGWHIECSTMSTALLGDTFDIHGGGQDLVFPHHENELAQSHGAGKPFARFWLHNGLLTVNGQKMSKSLGNFVTIRDALDASSADVLRYFFLNAHYKSPLDFNWEILTVQTQNTYNRLVDFIRWVEQLPESYEVEESPIEKVKKAEFFDAMDDDLNTPKALGALHELISEATPWLNKAKQQGWLITKPAGLSEEERQLCRQLRGAGRTVRELAEKVLGFSFSLSKFEETLEVSQLKIEREIARKDRNYAKADQIRKKLIEMGYEIEDTPGGTLVRKRV